MPELAEFVAVQFPDASGDAFHIRIREKAKLRLDILLREEEEAGGFFAVLEEASHAAKAGVDYTKTIAARKGRASLVGERSIGYEDPGAVSSMLMYRALYAFLKK